MEENSVTFLMSNMHPQRPELNRVTWKALEERYHEDPVIAVVMPNDPTVKEKKWTECVTTVDEVERQSGYDFVPTVPENVQRVIESRAMHTT